MKRTGKWSKVFGGGLVLLLLLSFAGHAFGNNTPKFAYVANSNPHGTTGDVSAYTIDSTTGALSPVSGSPFAAGSAPTSIQVDPSNKFVYVANSFSFTISAYAIDSTTGALSAISGSPFSTGAFPRAMAAHPSGKFLYVPNCGNAFCTAGGNVSAYTINSTTGALSPISGSPFAAGLGAVSVAVDPSGKFAFVANFGSNNVSAFTIDSTTGALSLISGSPFAAGSGPVSVAVAPPGTFAYVANQASNNVSAYTINSTTGALTLVGGSPFAAGSASTFVAVDPSGKFAYVPNFGANNVSAYTIDSTTGALSPISGSPFAAGTNPIWTAVDPSGKFAYAVNNASSSQNVSAYTINSTTGALSSISGSPFAAGTRPFAMAIAGTVTPAELITGLTNTVNSLGLQAGIANSLDAKLQAAQASLPANITSACNQMNAFVNEVMAQSGRHLTVAQADQLIAQANFIKTSLGCP